MTDNKYMDFDQFMAEKEQDSPRFKIKGREYEASSSPPLSAIVRLERIRLNKGDDAELSQMELEQMGVDILGREQFDQMMNDGVTLDEFTEIFRWIWQQYNPRERGETASDSGNVPRSISSSAGDSSKPTSSENTEST